MRIASACTTCFTYVNAQCVLYDGPILQTLNITETTNLEDILVTIDQYLTNLNGAGGDTIVQEGTFITILGDGSPGNPYIVNNSMTNTSSLVNDGEDGLNPYLTYSDIYQSPRLIEGNWSLDSLSGDYTYNVFVQRFILNNISYLDVGLYDQVTLADADPTLDRIDIIYIDNNLQLGVLSSTPAINPTTPFVDVETQLPLFQVLVEAGTQAPSGVTNLLVYDEDAGSPSEFDIISTASSINPADTSDPVGGSTYDILFNNPQNGDKIELRTLTDLINANNTANLIFRIKTPSEVRFNVYLEDVNGGNRSNQVQVRDGRYGYNSSVTDYQTIAIPLSTLQRNNDSYSTLVFRIRQSFVGLWTMDRVLFQAGISTPQSEQVTRTSQLVNDGEDSESPLKFILEAPSGGPFVRLNNQWVLLNSVYPSLDDVLTVGNTSTSSIFLNSDTSEVNITGLGSNSILSGKGLTIDGENNLSINKDGVFIYDLGNLKASLEKEGTKGVLTLGNDTGLYTSKVSQNEFVSENRSYFLPNRSGNLAMAATNGSFTVTADDFGVLDISPLLVSSGIGDQNNINTVFTFPVGTDFSITNLLTVINNSPLFTVSEIMNVFFEFTGLDQNSSPINEIWILTTIGKGNYGVSSGNTITELQIKKISNSSTVVSNIVNDANTQIITLGDLNGVDIDVLFNATDLTLQNPVQNQEEGYVIVNTSNAGDFVQYLFVGEGGVYGSVGGLNTANISDFILLTNIEENTSTQTIDLGEIGSANVEDIFNNTDLSPTGSNVNPIQDQSSGYVVVKTKNNGVDVDYLFIGASGDYGNINASLIAVDTDFLPFSPYVEDVDPTNLTWQRATSIGGANSFTEKVITGEANTYTNVILHNGPVMATDFVVSENGAIRNKVVNGGFVGLKIIGNNDVFISGANNNNADIVLGSLAGNQTAWSSTTKTTVHTRRRYVVDPILGTNTSFKRVYGFEARDIVNFDTATNSANYYASFVSNPEIQGTVLAAAPENIFALRGRGRVLLEDYGSGNVDDEIPAYSLAVSASGRIVEIALGGNIGVDPDAIHNNIANEFTIIPEETSPNLDSYLLLEDEIGLKKKVKLSNISSGSSSVPTWQEVIAEGNSSTLPIIIDNKNTTPTQFFGSALLTLESLMGVNGTSVGAALDHYRNPTADSSGSDIYATFNRLVSDSDFRDGRLQAFYSQAKYQGTAGLDTSMYGGRLESIFEGSGGIGSGVSSSDGFLIGVRSYTANRSNDNSNINSLRAFDSEAVMDSDNGTLNFLQGHHNNVTLIKGTINNDVSVNYLDFDYTSGTVNGDLAYITTKDTSIDFSFVAGTARFIDSLVPLPSRFAGSIESTGFILTNGTSDDVLLGDGSTTSLAAIGGGGVQSIVPGTNVTVDNTDPNNPVINASSSGGGYQNITENIDVNNDFSITIGDFNTAGIEVQNQGNFNYIQLGDFGLASRVDVASTDIRLGDQFGFANGVSILIGFSEIQMEISSGISMFSEFGTKGVTLKNDLLSSSVKYDINFPDKANGSSETFAMLSDLGGGTTSTFQSIYDANETGITSTDTFGNFSLNLERGGTGLQAKLNDVTYSFDFIAKSYMTSILDINETNSKIEFKQHSGLNVRGVSMSVSSIANSPYLEFKSSIDGVVAGGSLIFSERLQGLKNNSNAPATPTFYTAWQANGDAFLLGDPLGNSTLGGHLLINGFGASLMQGAGSGNARDSERRFLPTAFYDGTNYIHANDSSVTAGLPTHLGVVRLDLLNLGGGGGGVTPTLQEVIDASTDSYNSVYSFPNFNSRFIIDANDALDTNTRFGWNINEFDESKGNVILLGTNGGNQIEYSYNDNSSNIGGSSINVMNGDSVNFDTKSAVVEIKATNSDWTNIDSIIVGGIPNQALNHGISINSDYIDIQTPDFGKGSIFVSTDGVSPANSTGSGVVSITSSNVVLIGQISSVSTDVFIQVDNSSKEVFIYNLPTSLPSAPNSIWNDGGTLKIT